jgi:hypothetical protein
VLKAGYDVGKSIAKVLQQSRSRNQLKPSYHQQQVCIVLLDKAVAQLVERPIEIVEYQRHTCICDCGNLQTAAWPQDIIPGQDLGTSLQAFLGWANNYAHMPYEKHMDSPYGAFPISLEELEKADGDILFVTTYSRGGNQ